MKYRVPFDKEIADDLFRFWGTIFPGGLDCPQDVFLGSEIDQNHYEVYVERLDGKIVATCGVTRSVYVPRMGGFGEVATDPEYRGHGLATELCRRALADFQDSGGEALFLGTNNRAAARIYHRLGWRKLASSNVMASITSGESPEAFLVEYFRPPGIVSVQTAGPCLRVPIIPLLHTPHDWQILDANAGMYSTRYDYQVSCNGLYRRYHQVVSDGCGEWFAAVADDGRVVGLSTARLDNSNQCSVDAFAHQRFSDCLSELVQRAVQWGRRRGATTIRAIFSIEDEDKQRLFDSFGFQKTEPGDDWELAGRKVKSVQQYLSS